MIQGGANVSVSLPLGYMSSVARPSHCLETPIIDEPWLLLLQWRVFI